MVSHRPREKRPGNCLGRMRSALVSIFPIGTRYRSHVKRMRTQYSSPRIRLGLRATCVLRFVPYGLLGVWYMWRLTCQLWNEEVAGIAVVCTTLGTGLAAYLWFEPDMSHVISMSLISALFYYLYRIDIAASLDWRRWAGIGVLLGLIGSVRVPDLLVGIAALLTGVSIWQQADRMEVRIGCVASCAVGSVIAFSPQMLAWNSLYGGPLTRPPGVYQTFYWLTLVADYLFSTKRGILIWTPLLAVSLFGVVVGVSGCKWLRYGAVVLCLSIYFNATVPLWWAGQVSASGEWWTTR